MLMLADESGLRLEHVVGANGSEVVGGLVTVTVGVVQGTLPVLGAALEVVAGGVA